MRAELFLILAASAILLAGTQHVWAAALLALLMLADLIGGAVANLFGFARSAGQAISETAHGDFEELEAAKSKAPSGMKFFEEGFSRLGKEMGKGEAAKAQRKKTKDNLSVKSFVASVENLLGGIGKLMKR